MARLSDLALSRADVDRAVERRTDETWLEQAWASPDTRVLRVDDGLAPVSGVGDSLAWAAPREVEGGERYLLGVDHDGVAHFAVRGSVGGPEQQRAGLRQLGAVLGAAEAGMLVHAVALANWHATHRYCPRCGCPTRLAAAGAERRCPVDGSVHFPRTDPAVIVLVTDPLDRALLGRQHQWPEGRFSTLAGFVEPGEDAERAVRREVAEEAGVVVAEVEYLGSQPWPFPASLMLGFRATTTGSAPPRVDDDELAEAYWFSRGELRDAVADGRVVLPPPVSIALRLVEDWFGGPLPSGTPARPASP